ncbi:hypothetical protein EYF80_048622 [Liparis tanakae]|uniref:Uncharacterized protein n=1 Tax=Liparis tanakae TaxID=230148 RepID=A0A4Z2FJ37_9TELE|nr:hypothetical protein EYF80_048622 [Liparis tanakae]
MEGVSGDHYAFLEHGRGLAAEATDGETRRYDSGHAVQPDPYGDGGGARYGAERARGAAMPS